LRVGGKGFPATEVTSLPSLPPLGPTTAYCPDFGVATPGLSIVAFLVMMFYLLSSKIR
jgi:hypothetical protein